VHALIVTGSRITAGVLHWTCYLMCITLRSILSALNLSSQMVVHHLSFQFWYLTPGYIWEKTPDPIVIYFYLYHWLRYLFKPIDPTATDNISLILLSYSSYLFRLWLLSEDFYLLDRLQSAERKNAPKGKVTKRTHFYRKWKPLSCLFTVGNKNKNLYLPIV